MSFHPALFDSYQALSTLQQALFDFNQALWQFHQACRLSDSGFGEGFRQEPASFRCQSPNFAHPWGAVQLVDVVLSFGWRWIWSSLSYLDSFSWCLLVAMRPAF